MSKKSKRWLVMGLFFVFVLSGCKCDDNQIDIMEVFNDNPIAGEVISTLLPTFTFHNSESCEPDRYWINLSPYSESGWWGNNILTPDDSLTYALTNPLDPGKEYIWSVSGEKYSYGYSQYSNPTVFYTGPVCSGETLIAPDLENPGPAGWLESETNFAWTYNGGCLPLSYEVQFAWDAAFTDIYLTVTTTEPYAQHLLMAFPDCSTMFWRVRASDGTSTGPWSDSRDFHYIISGGCYQWHYESDDFANITVRLNMDSCDQTGYVAAWTATLNPGCMVDGMHIVGDGSMYSYTMRNYVVDLGAGPCPSTGLDQKTADSHAKFGVLTPGTYCVTISRDQTAKTNGPISLMDGVWSVPRSNQILVEETIEFGPGNHDYLAIFVWDETDRNFLSYPLDFTYACKFGPEDLCGTYDFAMKGDFIPLLGRDTNSEYKLSQLNGIPCFILLANDVINEKLSKYEGFDWRAEDLEFFPKPDPCATPEPEKEDDTGTRQKTCSDYSERECIAHAADGCSWTQNNTCIGP